MDWSNKAEVLREVRFFGLALKYADDNLKKDKEIAIAAIRDCDLALQYVDESIWGDKDIRSAVRLSSRCTSSSQKQSLGRDTESKYKLLQVSRHKVDIVTSFAVGVILGMGLLGFTLTFRAWLAM